VALFFWQANIGLLNISGTNGCRKQGITYFLSLKAYPSMRFSLCLLFAITAFSYTSAQNIEGSPNSRHYDLNVNGGFSVWGFLQDDKGLMWIATERWLVEYDGHSFKQTLWIKPFSLAKDTDGTIYVGCSSDLGYLAPGENGKVLFKSLKRLTADSALARRVFGIYFTPNKVFFTGSNCVFEYDKVKKTMLSYPIQSKDGQYRQGFISEDTLYVADAARGLLKMRDGVAKPAPYGNFFKGAPSYSPFDFGNTKVLGWNKKMIAYSPSSSKEPAPFLLKDAKGVSISLPDLSSTSLNNQYFLVGHSSTADGATLFDQSGTILQRFATDSHYPGRSINRVATDQLGNFWLGYYSLDNGVVTKTEHGRDLSVWRQDGGNHIGITTSVYHKGVFYVSSNKGLRYMNSAGALVPVSNEKLAKNRIFSINSFKVGNETKLIAAVEDGIIEIDGEKIIPVLTDPNQRYCYGPSLKNTNRLFASGPNQTVSLLYKNGQWMNEGVIKGINRRYAAVVEDHRGGLWMVDYDQRSTVALVEFNGDNGTDPKSLKFFTKQDGMGELAAGPQVVKDQLIIGTTKGFLRFNYDTQKFERWRGLGKEFCNDFKDGIDFFPVSDSVYYLMPGYKPTSIIRLTVTKRGDTLLLDKPFKRFPNNGTIENVYIDKDGTLWLSYTGGLIKYDARYDKRNYNSEFNCLIRKVQVGHDSTVFFGGLTLSESKKDTPVLSHQENNIRFEFAAPFYDKEEETLYSFQLNHSKWTDWNKIYMKEYTNLPEGRYIFRVKAKNIYGKESSTATYSFTVMPPWQRSWWAYALYVTSGVLFVVGAVRWRTANLESRKIALEKIVHRQTAELRNSNEELHATNEELTAANEELFSTNDQLFTTNQQLITTQKQLVVSEKMASLGQLTAGIAHEINNPINFISGGVQALQSLHEEIFSEGIKMSADELAERKQEIDQIMRSMTNGVMRTANIIKSLREFSSPVDSIAEDAQVDVHECLENALLLVGRKITDTRISVKKDFSAPSKVKANASQLGQVFVNLIDNSIFALAEKSGDKIITLQTSETGKNTIIKISDNGGGMPEAVQPHIFEPFYTTKDVGKGTGLGLFICYVSIR
jgi:signal transduction histidine kinase